MSGEETIRVRLTLRPERSWRGEPMVRLRRALKALLRSYGWRCIAAQGVEETVLPPELDAAAKETPVEHP